MPTTLHRAARALVVASASLAGVTVVLSLVLSFTYVPIGAQAWDDPTLGVGGTARTDLHRWSAVAWLLAAGLAVAVLAVRVGRTRPGRRGALALAGGVVSALAPLVALATRGLVQWDQLALYAVTVGGGIDGYWAALDDGVRFVLVEGTEVGRGAYAGALAAHLLAHGVGLAAAVATLVSTRSQRLTDGPPATVPQALAPGAG